MTTSDNRSLERLLIDYLEYLEVERHVSGYTLRNYDRYIRRFIDWYYHAYTERTQDSISLDRISKYRVYLSRYTTDQGDTLSRTTQSYYIIALRSWFRWMNKRDYAVLSPEKIELPKADSKSLHFLNVDQIERLLNQPGISKPIGLRDKAILEVLFSTGLRVSELVSLDRDQVDIKRREFGVIGKGRKIRVVFLSMRAAAWLSRYLDTREDSWQPVFIRYSREKSPITADGEKMRLSVRQVQRIVEKYRKKAHLSVPITPHGIRHSFATDLLRKGAGLREVQEMLGHEHVATTQIYTHVTNPQLREVHDTYHSGNEKD